MKIRAVVEFEVDTQPTIEQIKRYVEDGVYGHQIGFDEENPFFQLDERKVIVTKVVIRNEKGYGDNLVEYFNEKSPS